MFDFGSLFSGIGSFLGGNATAKGYKAAAGYYGEAARVTKLQGAMKDTAIRRQIFQVEGTAEAAAGANNLKLSGSVKDVVKTNRQQGFATKAVTAMQTNLEYQNYVMQAKQAKAAAKAAKIGGIMGLAGGVLGMFSDDRLKEDVKFIGRRGDGLGVYQFKFNDDETVYEGVMASEVVLLYPDAISEVDGYKVVNYDLLDIEFRKVA